MRLFRRIRMSREARRLAELALEETARALHAQRVALPESEVQVNQSLAALNTANAVATVLAAAPPNAVIDMGQWAVLKVTIGERCRANVIQLTPLQRWAWDRSPELSDDPRSFLARLNLAVDTHESVLRLEQGDAGAIGGGD